MKKEQYGCILTMGFWVCMLTFAVPAFATLSYQTLTTGQAIGSANETWTTGSSVLSNGDGGSLVEWFRWYDDTDIDGAPGW